MLQRMAVLAALVTAASASAANPFSAQLIIQTNETSNLRDGTLQSSFDFSSVQSFKMQAMVTINASKLTTSQRAPANIFLIVDRSGSMDGALDEVKESLEFIISQMNHDDMVSLIAYNHESTVECAPTLMDSAGKQLILTAIRNLYTGGSTALGDALLQGLTLLSDFETQNRTTGIFLFTDGHCNSGVCNGAVLQDHIIRERQSKGSFTVSTFAYGASHDSLYMSALAEAGRGSYVYISDPSRISTALADALGGVLSVVAQNVVLSIDLSEGARVSKVYAPGQTNSANDFSHMPLQDLQAGEHRDIPVELEISKLNLANRQRLGGYGKPTIHFVGRFQVVADGPGNNNQYVQNIDLFLTRSKNGTTLSAYNPKIADEILRFTASRRISEASHMLMSNAAKAREQLDKLKAELNALERHSGMKTRLLNLIDSLLKKYPHGAGGVAKLNTISQTLSYQRSTSLAGLAESEDSMGDFGARYSTASRKKTVQAAAAFVAQQARTKNRAL